MHPHVKRFLPGQAGRPVLLAAFAAVFILSAQQSTSPVPASQQEGPTIFRSDTRLVVLHTTVADKNGHLVTDLPQTAFTVFEN